MDASFQYRLLNRNCTDFSRFEVYTDEVEIQNQDSRLNKTFYYMNINEGVGILPVAGEKILLTREFRYPVNSWQLEIPGGLIDAGETPGEAAIRELREETGYSVKELHSLGSIYTSFGSSNEKTHLFLAICAEKGQTSLEEAEYVEQALYSFEEWEEMILDGRFLHGPGIAAYGKYRMWKEKIMRK